MYVVYAKMASASVELNANDKKNCIFINDTLKELAKKYSSIIKTSARISFFQLNITDPLMYPSEAFRLLSTVEFITKKLNPDSLILLVAPCTEMQAEFLNRVRLNTIKGHQIFFPIPFGEYMPNIVYPVRPFPDEIEINKNYGYFNTYAYEFVSFYNSDYAQVRGAYLDEHVKQLISYGNSSSRPNKVVLTDYISDLFDLFSTNKKLNLLRGTDQALKCRWHASENCERQPSVYNEKQRCVSQREASLGTKAQLAMHLMKNYNTLTKN